MASPLTHHQLYDPLTHHNRKSFFNPEDYCFARKYSETDFKDPEKTAAFLSDLFFWEGRFFGIAYNEASGLTYDGYAIDSETLEPKAVRNWSAASKESLHIAILALAIMGNSRARTLIDWVNPDRAVQSALYILERKISSYEKFDREQPGFGGFLPWFTVSDHGFEPLAGWADLVPALDNGQLAWSIYLVYDVLEQTGNTALSARYKKRFDLMAHTCTAIFYDGRGLIRAEARILDTIAVPIAQNYVNNVDNYYLDDPYEGELMAFFITLFSTLGKENTRLLWQRKQKNLLEVKYETPGGNLAVVRGHWYSSHEKWNFLVLPYLDVPLAKKVFLDGEWARTRYSTAKRVPGLFASVHDSEGIYLSACGIQELATERVTHRRVISPYAAFPTILAGTEGLAWLNLMLQHPKMQTPYGAAESFDLDTGRAAPLLTWDGKMTTVLAALGGVHAQIAACLKKDGKYAKFYSVCDTYFSKTFCSEDTSTPTILKRMA